MKFIEVFIQNNITKIDTIYTYSTDLDLEPGMRVIVPFGRGNSVKVALVLRILDDFNESYKVKKVIKQIDYSPIITEDLIKLGFYMNERYLTTFNQSFMPILPPGDFKTLKTEFKIVTENNLSDDEKNKLRNLNEQSKEFISTMIKRGIIKNNILVETKVGIKEQTFVKLKSDYINIISEKNEKLTDKQADIIKYLAQIDEIKQSELLKELKISNSPIKTLEKKNIISVFQKEVKRDFKDIKQYKNHNLNIEQVKAVDGILNGKNKFSLLHGMTGSGKTEVYLKISEEVIKQGGQVIVLVPEIGLTPQMIERFFGRFNGRVAVIHSKLSKGERYDAWRKIKNGEVDIVVGARSAVFAPFENLKLIIIDEEHDNSYRFHNALRYNTLEVAEKRVELVNGKLVLGSATPDVSTYFKVEQGEYNLLRLNKRAVQGASLPDIEIVDMRDELIRGNLSIFSESLRKNLINTMENKKQAILFLNRRGFSQFISCRSCGHVIKCDNCDISMTYHKSINKLRCHYCGITKPMPEVCPICGSKYIKQFGIGTQQVEEECKKLFPNKNIIRMDRDTTHKKDSYEKVYELMKNKEADILIGTQMLAKGLDFKDVTLVGVIAADLSLHISDYKSEENTFDLLTQVSGRAGRAKERGKVIIQTYSPDNYAIKHASKYDYLSFYKEEIEFRKEYGYPPFVEMINIYFASENNQYLEGFATDILLEIGKEISGYEVQHSRLIKMPKIQNIYKTKFTLKVEPRNIDKLSSSIKRVLNNNKNKSEKLNIYTDIEFVR